MSEEDYKAISKIIEEVVGKDTIMCVKLLEGIRFYLDNKAEKIQIINANYPGTRTVIVKNDSIYSKEADIAMKKYTKNLQKEVTKLKDSGKYCGVKG